MKYKVLDLFSGCGGLSFGLEEVGFDVIAGIDNWEDSLRTFKKNHPRSEAILLDLANIDPERDLKHIKNIDVVVGGPPCQGFSIAGKRDPDDDRNKLYQGFVKTVKHYKPKVFLMENVPNLASMEKGALKDAIIDDFVDLGYKVQYKILLASDYGVPQNRRRMIMIGTLSKSEFQYPAKLFGDESTAPKITTGEALSDLPEESAEDGSENNQSASNDYQELMRAKTSKIHNHVITNHAEKTVSTIALVPDGGNYKDLPEELQGTRKVNIAWTRYSSMKPSLTIDTGHRHHFHYKWNRVPTVRESARLQSFPDHFIFEGSKTSQYKQVGNAVPPIMAEAIGKSIKDYLDAI